MCFTAAATRGRTARSVATTVRVRRVTSGLIIGAWAAAASAAAGAEVSVPPPGGSIYRVTRAADVPLLLFGVLGSAIPYALSSRLITPSCPCDPGRVNALDRRAIGNHNHTVGRVSDVTVALALATPLAVSLVGAPDRAALLEDLTVMIEAVTINGALVSLTKLAVRRPLPRTYENEPGLVDDPRGYRSFYSGHTSYAFAALSAAAVTVGLRHDRYLIPWLATALVGTSVAVERVVGGYHFASDVMVGALMGTAVGVAVPLLHARRRGDFRLGLVPAAGGGLVMSLAGSAW
jgi:membrane-associated phospholipid phosphatase